MPSGSKHPLDAVENRLKCEFPASFRATYAGEPVFTEVENWEIHAPKDIVRTAREPREPNLPNVDGVEVGADAGGNRLLLLIGPDGKTLPETLWCWNHETRELTEVAKESAALLGNEEAAHDATTTAKFGSDSITRGAERREEYWDRYVAKGDLDGGGVCKFCGSGMADEDVCSVCDRRADEPVEPKISGPPTDDEIEDTAAAFLLGLHEHEHIQLVNLATARTLSPRLSRMLQRMDPSQFADWLIEQDGVSEVYASDDVLAEALERAQSQLRAGAFASKATPLDRDFVSEDDRWVCTASVDLGWGTMDVRFVSSTEPKKADVERFVQIEKLLDGSWATLWGPALSEHWGDVALFRDPARAAAALEGIEVYLKPDHWSAQLTFDDPEFRDTGFFFDLKGDRVVDTTAVD